MFGIFYNEGLDNCNFVFGLYAYEECTKLLELDSGYY